MPVAFNLHHWRMPESVTDFRVSLLFEAAL